MRISMYMLAALLLGTLFADVPAGEYVVMAWYKGKTRKQNVKIPAKGSASVRF